MADPDAREKEALAHAGAMGGEYLSSLGRYDLSKLSVEEWDMFLQCVVFAFSEKLADIEERSMKR